MGLAARLTLRGRRKNLRWLVASCISSAKQAVSPALLVLVASLSPRLGRTLYYGGKTFQSLKGAGFKSNYYCVETGENYWISGPKRRGGDALYGGSTPIEIDSNVREEYWMDIRQQPKRVLETVA